MTSTTTTPSASVRRVRTAEPVHHPAGRHQRAARRAVEANTTHFEVRLGDNVVRVELPPVDKLVFYAGVAGLAAFGVIEWPIAVITGVGHLLSDNQHNRTLHALGEALDAV